MSIIIRRNPVREIAEMQRVMDRLFDDTWRNFGGDDNNDRVLAIDVHETADAYILMANLPGVQPQDIDITLHDGVLTLSGSIQRTEASEGVRVHIQERIYGQFTRSLRLPKAVDADHVEAHYENGVLTLTLPKTPDAQPRQIPVKNGKLLVEPSAN